MEQRTDGRWVSQGVKLRNKAKRLLWLNNLHFWLQKAKPPKPRRHGWKETHTVRKSPLDYARDKFAVMATTEGRFNGVFRIGV